MNPAIQITSNLKYPIGKIINQELQNSLNTQIAVAFLKRSGVKTIEESLMASLNKGGQFELIVGLDFKTTDPLAMKFFIDLHKQNKNVRFYCYGDKGDNKNDIVFHPKIYLFQNSKEYVSIIGSTNLTHGGLMSNLEVNTIFTEKHDVYYKELQSIYNSIKFTNSVFMPDEEYIEQYNDVFKAFEQNEKIAKTDIGIQKVICQMTKKESQLPGTIPSVNAMIVDLLKQRKESGFEFVTLPEIYSALEQKISNPIFAGHFKVDTFRNTIRGELNKHHDESNYETSLKLYKRVGKGIYTLTSNGECYFGR